MKQRYRIQFPPLQGHELGQHEAYFYLVENGQKTRLRFHDYDEIYSRPGLYEQIFYDRLKCNSPQLVGEILHRTLQACGERLTERRAFDFGAGNGIMGDVLKSYGVSRLVGADILPEAKEAVYRDRPGVYDEYYVADFTQLTPPLKDEISKWSIDCLTSVAALGFGDIPPAAFFEAMQFVQEGGWIAFNIKDTFLDKSDTSGFSRFVRELIFSEYLDVFHMEKYRHRLSMEGLPIFYFALVARKAAEIPDDFLKRYEIGE